MADTRGRRATVVERLRERLWHPTTIAIPGASLALVPLWQHHLIAHVPLWAVVALAPLLKLVDLVCFVAFGDMRRRWQVWVSITAIMACITAGAYTLGWGPYLGVILVFAAIDWFRLLGAQATRPAATAAFVSLGAAQGAVALHWAPILTARGPALLFGALGAGAVAALIAMLGWVTADKEAAEARTRQRERYFSALVARSRDITVVADPDGRLRYASPAFARALGYDGPTDRLTVDDLVSPDDLQVLSDALQRLRADTDGADTSNGPPVVQTELRLRTADGATQWYEAVIADLLDDPDVRGIVANLRDIAARKEAEDRLAHAASHDPLTGLANRTLTLDLADRMLARASRDGHPVLALYVDVDDFKEVNDTHGHAVGDRVLEEVAVRLTRAVRDGDVVGRLGGDEFVVVAAGPFPDDEPTGLAQRVLDALARPIALGDGVAPLHVGASIGVASAVAPPAADLLRDADLALYRAKASGKGRAETHRSGSVPTTARAGDMARQLEQAVAEGQFFVEYQPLVALDTLDVTGAEVLLRWRHPRRGTVPPLEFLPVLEQTGLIEPVGRWVLGEACQQAAAWHRDGSPLRVSINLSARQLLAGRIVEDITRTLARTGCPPELLQVEVSERSLLTDLATVTDRLGAIRALGVTVAVDDVGTGASVLTALHRLPVDVIKIDRTFVDGMLSSHDAGLLVESVVTLGRMLGIRTVAEGVERPEQLGRLRAARCGHGQGFLFARPVTAVGLTRLVAQHGTDPTTSAGSTLRGAAAAAPAVDPVGPSTLVPTADPVATQG